MGVIAAGAAVALGLACYALFRKKPDPEEIERLRRLFLSEHGRITDATLLDPSLGDPDLGFARASDERPQEHGVRERQAVSVLLYQYKVAGVQYECAQDVSRLPDQVRHVRLDLPVQVRYDPHNPSNSIVVAESWNGLRLDPDAPL